MLENRIIIGVIFLNFPEAVTKEALYRFGYRGGSDAIEAKIQRDNVTLKSYCNELAKVLEAGGEEKN